MLHRTSSQSLLDSNLLVAEKAHWAIWGREVKKEEKVLPCRSRERPQSSADDCRAGKEEEEEE